jgi:TatA/E family protein of Tat protein translocase
MGEFSIFHWLVVLAIVLIFFGGRRIPEVMKGLGEGIRSFKDGMSGAANGGGAATATATAALVAPSGLTAKSNKNSVTLSWSAAAGAGSYNVKRSGTSGGPYALIAAIAATNYTDEGLAGGTYYYVVTSMGAAGESSNSIEVSGTSA